MPQRARGAGRRARLYGLDGCRHEAWVVAASDAALRTISFRIANDDDLEALFDECARGRAVAVLDVPIGLTRGPRACDRAARRLLGARASSVFSPPCREALAARAYDEANATNRQCCGAGISRQAFNLGSRIRTVDRLISPALQAHAREGHPEVVFALLNGGHPVASAKRTAAGIAERLRLLQAAGVPAFDPVGERLRLGRSQAAVDDLLDAAALLLVARDVAAGRARCLPEDREERDERGLVMQMWGPGLDTVAGR